MSEIEEEQIQNEIKDEVFEKAEQEVMSFLPEMEEAELKVLCQEIGLEIPEDKKGRGKLYRFVFTYLMGIEETDVDQGKARYIQIHGVLRQLSVDRMANMPQVDVPAQAAVINQNTPVPSQ